VKPTLQAFRIASGTRGISAVEIDGGLQGIRRPIGFDSVDADETGAEGDRLHTSTRAASSGGGPARVVA
jgi:hypothetical protein